MKAISNLLLFSVLCACSETSEIGASFFKEDSLGLTYTDTLTLNVSTVTYDSIITGAASRLLVGYHEDAELGNVMAATYFRMEPRTSNNEGEPVVYTLENISTDYLKTSLVLWHDAYSYYDTSDYQTIYVHRLTSSIESADDGNLYNTTDTRFEQSSLGHLSFRPKPNSSDPIEIPLEDAFGQEIYSGAVVGDNNLATTESFVEEYLKGFSLRPDNNESKALLGFNTNAELRIYYLDRSVVPSEEKYLTFFVSTLRYNQILSTRGSSPLSTITSSRESVRSTLTNRTSYIQGGAGLSMRIDIPYLRSVLLENPNLIVTQVVLEFKPIKGSDEINTPLPLLLKLYAVNKRNEIYVELLSTEDAEGFISLSPDYDLGRDTNYSTDVSAFIKSQLQNEEFNKNALLISLPSSEVSSTVNRLYVGDQNNDYEMKLILHFAYVR